MTHGEKAEGLEPEIVYQNGFPHSLNTNAN